MHRLPTLALLCAVSAHAAPWRYSLTPGQTRPFHYHGVDDVSAQLPMVGAVTQHLVVDTDFTLKVLSRLPDGRADVEVRLGKVTLTGAGGPTTIAAVPAELKVLRAYLSARGQFEFYRRVVVEVMDDGAYAFGRIDSHGASASAQANGERITATAAIDPKTGRVSATISTQAAAPTTHLEERREPTTVELLPAQVLSLLELPEGPVTEGEGFSMKLPSMSVEGRGLPGAACGKARCGRLAMKASMDGSQGALVQTAGAMGADDEAQGAMQDGMAQANAQLGQAMGLPGGAPAPAPGMQLTLDVELTFDPAAGALFRVGGTVDQVTSMGPVQVTSKSVFSLDAR
jgi:hypothetical protein